MEPRTNPNINEYVCFSNLSIKNLISRDVEMAPNKTPIAIHKSNFMSKLAIAFITILYAPSNNNKKEPEMPGIIIPADAIAQ